MTNDQDDSRKLTNENVVYLSATSKISDEEVEKQIKEIEINNNLKTRAMYAHEIIEKKAEDRGRQEGLERGRQQERQERVIKLWQKGMESSMISNIMDLSIAQVDEIISAFKDKTTSIQ